MESNHLPVERLSSLLDGELDPNERAEAERHLAGCEICRSELESLRSTVMRLSALPRVALPRSFTLPDAAPMMGAARPRPWQRPELLRTFAGLAAALMLVVVVADAYRSPPASFTRTGGAPAAAPALAPSFSSPAPADTAGQRALESAPVGGTESAAPQPRAAVPPAFAPQSAVETPTLTSPQLEPEVKDARPQQDQVRAIDVPEPSQGPGVAQVSAVALGALAIMLLVASFAVRRA